MKTLLLVTGACVVGVPLLIYVIGNMLPIQHTAEVVRDISADMTQVANWVRDIAGQTAWRRDVKKIEILERTPILRYREFSSNGEITFLFRELETGRQFESTIDDPKLPFGGKWLITLQPKGSATQVVIREEGEVRSPIFRFFSKYVFGHEKTLRSYLDQLAARAAAGGV